jgi:Zn-dependent protease/CBS domain-containing protein
MNREEQNANVTPGSVFGLRILGVPVRFHFTFILLVVFLGAIGLESPSGAQAAIYILALFASVLLHELGHAVVSKAYGIRVLEIVMFPIGGVARMERNPKPKEELWIALAGPAVNIIIAGLIIGGTALMTGTIRWESIFSRRSNEDMIGQIAAGNVVLALFNLLPAFPMDGGRVLRALLAMRQGESAATATAARAGRVLAILMGLYGLISANFILLFVAFFVYLGAVQENAAAVGRSLTQGVPLRAAMVTDFRTLTHGQTLRDAANLLLATSQLDFPVVYGEQVLGLLGRSRLLRAMANEGPDAYVSTVMDREFVALPPATELSDALPALAQAGGCVLVMEDAQLLGMLTTDNVTEYLILRRLGMEQQKA